MKKILLLFLLLVSIPLQAAEYTGLIKMSGVRIEGAIVSVYEDLKITPSSVVFDRDTTDIGGVFTVSIPESLLLIKFRVTDYDPYRYNEKYEFGLQGAFADSFGVGTLVIDTLITVIATFDTVYVVLGEVDSLTVNLYFRSKGVNKFDGTIGARGFVGDSLEINGPAHVDSTLSGRGASMDSVYATSKLVIPVVAGDPGDLVQGMIWLNSVLARLSYYDGASTWRLQQVSE